MRRQQADLRCAHEPPAGTVASATFESEPSRTSWVLISTKIGQEPPSPPFTVTITQVRIAGDEGW